MVEYFHLEYCKCVVGKEQIFYVNEMLTICNYCIMLRDFKYKYEILFKNIVD